MSQDPAEPTHLANAKRKLRAYYNETVAPEGGMGQLQVEVLEVIAEALIAIAERPPMYAINWIPTEEET